VYPKFVWALKNTGGLLNWKSSNNSAFL